MNPRTAHTEILNSLHSEPLSEFPSVVTEIAFPLSGDLPTMSTGELLNIQPDELQFPCMPFISKQSLSYFFI